MNVAKKIFRRFCHFVCVCVFVRCLSFLLYEIVFLVASFGDTSFLFSQAIWFYFTLLQCLCGRMNKIWTNSFSVSIVCLWCLENSRQFTIHIFVADQTADFLIASLVNGTTARANITINWREMCETHHFSHSFVSHARSFCPNENVKETTKISYESLFMGKIIWIASLQINVCEWFLYDNLLSIWTRSSTN